MSSQVRYPGSAENGTTVAGTQWEYNNSATASFLTIGIASADGLVCAPDSGMWCDTKDLLVYNFGFSIPTTDIIVGIQVDVYGKGASTYTEKPVDFLAKLLINKAHVGVNRLYGSQWPTSLTWMAHGGSLDLWGRNWTPAEINSSLFGFAIATTSSADCYYGGHNPSIDTVKITVYHEKPKFTLFFGSNQ